jgi:dihydroorotase
MTHIAVGADVPAALARLRPGDVVTHAFTASGPGILGDDGRLLPEAHEARRRGVRFDVGHGCGSFSWATAAQALDEGFGPDAISTDLHRYSIERPVGDLPTTMSRYLALGLSLSEVIAATTITPAAILGRTDLGSLRPGHPGDVTVLRIEEGPVELADSNGVLRTVPTRLVPVLTVVAGTVHRAADVEVPLRPYLDADREVDCAVPI